MKQEKKKPGKKRLLLYYLVLAVCILIIAAVTVTVVLAVTGKKDDLVMDPPSIDNSVNTGNSGGGEQQPQEPDAPTVDNSSRTEFIFPVENVNVSQTMSFWEDVTLTRYLKHKGMDFAGSAGDKVMSVLDGRVVDISTSKTFGTTIRLSHDNGIFTVYKYIDAAEGLEVGQEVSRGQIIGAMAADAGNEREEGPHLHFEVYKGGELADPAEYIEINQK